MVKESQPIWRPSNIEPIHKVLPNDSILHGGVPVLDRVMYACSNTELKPVTLLYGLNSNPTHLTGIFRRIDPLLGDQWNKDSLPGNMARVMHAFMLPTGFAEEPAPWHFATTPQGDAIAKDSAAFLLKKAVDLGMPLGTVFQERTEETNPPSRAYITRIAVLLALMDGSLSQASLQDKFGDSVKSLRWNLHILAERKLIMYEAFNPEVKGQHTYQRLDMSAIPSAAGRLAQSIVNYFKVNDIGNNHTIAKALGREEHTHNIGRALRQLAKAGVIEPVKWVWAEKQSEATITLLGKRVVEEVIIPLLSASAGDDDAARMLAETREELEQNPSLAAKALDQYKSQRTTIPEAETQQGILSLVQRHGAQRRNQILTVIGKNAHPQLIELVATGQLRTIRDGNASFYVLPDSEEQPKRTEEVITFDYNTPPDIFRKQDLRKRDKYRSDLDTVEFWRNVHDALLQIPEDQYTARSFFLQYDPKQKDWPDRWYSGIFSNHIRALWNLGIKHPWEFIRTYKMEDAPPELSDAIQTAQVLINRVLPLEYEPRMPAPQFEEHVRRLYTPQFWRELAADAQAAPPNTTVESFLWRFDPEMEGNMGRGHHHGKYYNFRHIFDKHTIDGAILLVVEFRPSEEAPTETILEVREAQAALRKHLIITDVLPDDFSDIEILHRQLQEEAQRQKEKNEKLQALKVFFEREYHQAEIAQLTTTTADRVCKLRANIRGHDVDEASLASIGFNTIKLEGGKLMADTFPAELKAAFLVFAFEQWRIGENLPKIEIFDNQYLFRNGEIKKYLQVLEKYLRYFEGQAKKKNPKAVLNASKLLTQLQKHISSLVNS